MNQEEYRAFTATLQHTLERDPRVLGLMAVGSTACLSHQPDEWSDHDFWVIVEPGAEEWFHTHCEWLPDSEQIVLLFREPHGGFKTVYRSGHLLEFAVSDRRTLLQARINDYQMLIDRIGLTADVARMQEVTASESNSVPDDLCLLGQFITNLLVGVGRYRRGEYLSARQVITVVALHALLRLISRRVSPNTPAVLDNLDPYRRVELAYPEIGAEINQLLQLDLDQAALGLLGLADHLLQDRLVGYPAEAVEVVRRRIAIQGLPCSMSNLRRNMNVEDAKGNQPAATSADWQ